MTSKILLLCLLLSVTSSALSQQMHRWVDDEGNIHFSQTPPPDQSRQESEIVTYGEKPGQGVDASCCNDVRSFAIEVGNYLRTGGSLDAVHEAFPVSTYPQITEIVNFFGRRERGSQSRFDISNRIHSACMNRALQACR